MSDQTNSQATNVNPITGQKSNVLDEEDGLVLKCSATSEPPVTGFLQLCADRRFHRCIQEQFQRDAGLSSSEYYWIHADAGGTPKMADLRTAPNYCYHDKKVRLMGWSAHGNICGGFKPGTTDDVIRQALFETAENKVEEYP